MKKVRIGVMGAYRGTSMINYCEGADNAQVVAICDKWVEGLERQKKMLLGNPYIILHRILQAVVLFAIYGILTIPLMRYKNS